MKCAFFWKKYRLELGFFPTAKKQRREAIFGTTEHPTEEGQEINVDWVKRLAKYRIVADGIVKQENLAFG